MMGRKRLHAVRRRDGEMRVSGLGCATNRAWCIRKAQGAPESDSLTVRGKMMVIFRFLLSFRA